MISYPSDLEPTPLLCEPETYPMTLSFSFPLPPPEFGFIFPCCFFFPFFLFFFFFFFFLFFVLFPPGGLRPPPPPPEVIICISSPSSPAKSSPIMSIIMSPPMSSNPCSVICPAGPAADLFSVVVATVVLARSFLSFLICVNLDASTLPSSLDLPPPAMPIPSRPSTNDSGSKSLKSFIPSPTPTNFTGNPSSLLTATTLPPLALPSSLVSMSPVRPSASSHCLAESSAMRPCAASITNRVSCGTSKLSRGFTFSSKAVDMRFCMTRFILTNSAVRASLLLSLPLVSTNSTSYPSPMALSNAPYNTAEGPFVLSLGEKQSTSARSAHSSNWATAPARNVSHAASSTF
mmetsp:Transcript_39210/g.83712  ORF Transcript_39210/g.83712 Transcript_39210/m.83712 type:complete len:347 (+) Transcript_39210:119-1159(+)